VVLDISLLVIMYLYFFSTVERPVEPLIPNKGNLRRLQEAFLNFFTFNRRKRFDSSRPDPLNAILFLGLHGLVVFQLFTGLQLYASGLESGYSVVGSWWPSLIHLSTDWTLVVFGGLAGVRLWHHATMYPIIAWALLHIYYEVWRTIAWREGDITIAFGGYKLAPPK
jgi:Ni/Fe-hydrogenase 1 B-type cytochrome subunit